MKIYKAKKKGAIHYVLIGVIALPFLIFFSLKETITESPFILLPLLSPIVLVLWIYFDTSYKIQDGYLYYRSGFLKGKIDIATIRELKIGKTMWSGIKPALATKGIIVKYNAFDEIYIAPQCNDVIVADLLEINPAIVVIKREVIPTETSKNS